MAKLESILQFIEAEFRVDEFPDYSHALNGLQVEGPCEVERVVAAVDAAEATIKEAVARDAHLLLVHHGLFWGGLGALTGSRFRKVAALIRGGLGLYSLHLPLDAHPQMGNAALLTRGLGLEPGGTFGAYKGEDVGVWAELEAGRGEMHRRLEEVVAGEVRLIPGGPETLRRVGILTGAGASFLEEARGRGLDTLITGEGAHHHFHQAMEEGINLFLAGHYATETFGVKALAKRLTEEFGVESSFLECPTGL